MLVVLSPHRGRQLDVLLLGALHQAVQQLLAALAEPGVVLRQQTANVAVQLLIVIILSRGGKSSLILLFSLQLLNEQRGVLLYWGKEWQR